MAVVFVLQKVNLQFYKDKEFCEEIKIKIVKVAFTNGIYILKGLF